MIEPEQQGEGADRDGQDAVEGRKPGTDRAGDPSKGTPPAGPHATPEKTNEDATPGSGALPDKDDAGSVEPGSG